MEWTNAKCVILCAGKGSRLLPDSIEKPKVMLNVHNKPILAYIIDYWRNFTDDFIFVVKFKKEEIIKYVKDMPVRSQFVEQEELKGIANAVSYVKDKVSDNFIVVLGDCYCKGHFNFSKDMEQGIGVWETNNRDDIKQSYAVRIKDNLVSYVKEKPKRVFNNLCGMGFYFFNKKVFGYISSAKPSNIRNEIEITDVIQNMIEDGSRLVPVFFKGDYLNITYPRDLKKAEYIFSK